MFEQRIRRLHALGVATVMKSLPCVAYSPVTVFRRFPPLAIVQSEPIPCLSEGVRLYFPSLLRKRHHES
jgi:hypothetical protein